MKTSTKKLTIVLVVALLLVTMFTLVACGNNDKGGDVKATAGKFTVQVLLPDGTPAAGVRVQLCVVDESMPGGLGSCYMSKDIDDKGVSVQEWSEELMEIHLENIPDGYKQKDSDAKKHIKKGELVVITLEQA